MYPKVRFRGFDEPWKKVKLEEISERVNGNDNRFNLPVLTISAKTGWMTQEDRFSGDISGKQKKNYTLLHKGELSYNHGNSKVAKYGAVFSLQNYSEALIPHVYHSFKIIKETTPVFIENFFKKKDVNKQLRKYISSSARMDGLLNISYSDFMKVHLFISQKISETKQIDKIFEILNSLLSLQQRKLELMKQLYRYLLENLNTEKKHPNIFIKGNYSHWNKVKLSDLGEIRTGKTPTPSVRSNYTNIGMPFVTPTEIVDLYNYNTSRFISNSGLKKAQIAPKGSILVTCIASIGKNTCVFKEKVAFNQQINAVTPNSFNDSTFLAFKSLQWSKRIDCLTANTAMQIINKKDFSNIETMVPNLNEQKDISKIWLKSYSLTYKYSDAKKLIIRLKKFLLQNLFI